jgi:hypothetical protein
MATKHKAAAKKKAASKKKKKKGSPVRYLNPKASKYKGGKAIRRAATRRVDSDIRRQEAALNREGSKVRRERDYATGQANDLLTRSKGDLDYIYGEVADTQQAQDAKIAEAYGATKGKVSALQQALQGEMADTSAANKSAAMEELARLGIQQTGTGRFDADASYAQQLAQQSGANTNANLDIAQGMSADIGAMLQSMAAGQHQSSVGKAVNLNQESVSKLAHTANEQLMDLVDEGKDARMGRGNAIADLYDQMYNTRFNQWAQTREMNFNQRLGAMQFNQSEAQRRKENAIAAAARRRAAQSHGGGGGGGGGGTSYSSSGHGSTSYRAPSYSAPKPKRKNPLDVLVPKKKKKLKNYFGSHYSPSGKFLDFR